MGRFRTAFAFFIAALIVLGCGGGGGGGTATRSKWTVMVFMNAANDLYPFSTFNMNQIERVAQNPDVRFVVQWKQSRARFPGSSFDGTRRYLAKSDNTNAIQSTLVQNLGSGVDMGSYVTLRSFVNWTKQRFPADRYCLVIWNHGNGWQSRNNEVNWPTRAVSYDDETHNAIEIWELRQALEGTKVDILAWDASLMQMLEVAYEVRDHARYVVGSEESPPGAGYPYDLVFDNFRDAPDLPSATLAQSFVDGMLAVPEYQINKITQSVLDTDALPALRDAITVLAQQLRTHSAALQTVIQSIRQQAQSYSPHPARVYRDLIDVCLRLEAATSIPEVVAASSTVRSAATAAIVYEGHNANSPGSTGISIDFSDGALFADFGKSYGLMTFAQDSGWDEWLAISP